MWWNFICLIVLFSCSVFSQNDENKNVEWDENDPRWDAKIPNWWDEENFVPPVGPQQERSKSFWLNQGQQTLNKKINQKLNENKAKNVVIFIGDGMGLGTQMATRSYMNDVNTELSFEKFQHSGLAKTYCINYQIPDSSCTATAILTGSKNNYGTISVDGNVNLRNCAAQRENKTHIDSIFKYAQDAGLSTGVITTTRITHATPATIYSHSSSRYWESNENAPEGCDDIAYQLIHGEIGSKLDAIMGGGRRHFLPNTESGYRTDNRNLINEYLNRQMTENKQAQVVQNKVKLIDCN
jgi:alkaline phosphatase